MKKLTAVFTLLLLVFSVQANTIFPLIWDASPTEGAMYELRWGNASGSYTNSVDIGTNQTATLEASLPFYAVCYSYVILNGQKVYSEEPSNEYSFGPPESPGNLRIRVSVEFAAPDVTNGN